MNTMKQNITRLLLGTERKGISSLIEYLDQGTDCLRLVEEIYKKEKNFHIYEGDSPVTLDWYVKNPERLIRLAVEHGEVITSISDAKKFPHILIKDYTHLGDYIIFTNPKNKKSY